MTRLLTIGLAALCLILCVSCSSSPQYVQVPEVVRVTPPPHLLLQTTEPPCNATTNGELLECWQDVREALSKANADKAALKRWVDAGEQE